MLRGQVVARRPSCGSPAPRDPTHRTSPVEPRRAPSSPMARRPPPPSLSAEAVGWGGAPSSFGRLSPGRREITAWPTACPAVSPFTSPHSGPMDTGGAELGNRLISIHGLEGLVKGLFPLMHCKTPGFQHEQKYTCSKKRWIISTTLTLLPSFLCELLLSALTYGQFWSTGCSWKTAHALSRVVEPPLKSHVITNNYNLRPSSPLSS